MLLIFYLIHSWPSLSCSMGFSFTWLITSLAVRSSLVLWGPICQLMASIPVQLESYSENLYLPLYHIGFCLCALLEVSDFQVSHLGLSSFWIWFLYVTDIGPNSFSHMWTSSFLSSIFWRCCLSSNVYFWHLCQISDISGSFNCYYFSEVECKLLVLLVSPQYLGKCQSHTSLSINILLWNNCVSHCYNKIIEIFDLPKVRVYTGFTSMIEWWDNTPGWEGMAEKSCSLYRLGNKEEEKETGISESSWRACLCDLRSFSSGSQAS